MTEGASSNQRGKGLASVTVGRQDAAQVATRSHVCRVRQSVTSIQFNSPWSLIAKTSVQVM